MADVLLAFCPPSIQATSHLDVRRPTSHLQISMLHSTLRLLFLVALCGAAVLYANHVPAVVPATAPATAFSAERAMAHVRAIAQKPHPIGSEENRRVAQYLVEQLGALGAEVQVQETTGIGTRYPVVGRVRNVVARLRGTNPGGAVLLMAHYDGVAAGPGAGDDASGTSVLLETLRALRAGGSLTHDVIALLADGEEAGLLGAAAFVREHPWARDVAFTMNFEARGTRGPSLMFETGAGNLDAARLLRGAPGPRATSLSTFVYRRLPNDTDLSETARLEKPAMNFAFIGGVDRYHTAQDDTVHLDPRSIQDHGDQALALTRALASGPLPRPATGDAVFFDAPLVGLVVYPEGWSLALALLPFVALALVLLPLRRVEPGWGRGLVLGAGGALASVMLSAALGMLIATGLPRVHGAIGSGVPAASGIYVAAVALASLAVCASVYTLLRKWAPAIPLQAGGVLLVGLIGLLTAVTAPAVSFVFIWPALFAALGLVAWRARPRVAGLAAWIGTIFVAFLLAPIAYLMGAVALGLDTTGAAAIAIFAALGCWLAAHAFETSGEPAMLTPLMAWSLTAFALGLGLAMVRTNERNPVGSMFGYGVDADSNVAFLGVQGRAPGAVKALRAQMDANASPRVPAWFGSTYQIVRAAPAPATPIGVARVTVVADSATADGRRVLLRVVPADSVRSIGMHVNGTTVSETVIDGRVVDPRGYRYPQSGRWSMDYQAPSDSGFLLGLTMPNTRPFTLVLLNQLPGVPAGVRYPTRPPGVVPIQRGDYTLVWQRVRVE